jgi:hypothetical protein
MTRAQQRIVWSLALLLVVATAWMAARRPDPYRAGAPLGALEDRREHHFRDLGWSSTQRLFEGLLDAAGRAPAGVERARILARVAALQHERGIEEGARAAAAEAMRLGGDDPEVRRLLGTPLEIAPPGDRPGARAGEGAGAPASSH